MLQLIELSLCFPLLIKYWVISFKYFRFMKRQKEPLIKEILLIYSII